MKKARFVILVAFILFFTFCFVGKVAAVLYINEFSSGTSNGDWIEIYNSEDIPVDLSGYILRDLTSTNKIEPSGIIDGNSFAVFDWSNKLNNSGDTIRLLLKSDESLIDQIIYGEGGNIQAPSGTQTAGRTPDGSISLVLLSSQSKGLSNNSSQALPTPTLTPIPTFTPAPTSKPTPTQKQTPTTKPVVISLSPTKIINVSSSSTSKTSQGKSLNEASSAGPTAVLGVQISPQVTQKISENKKDIKILGESENKIPMILIVIGIVLGIGCAILSYFLYFGKKENKDGI